MTDPVPSKDRLTDEHLLAHARAYDQGPGATFEFDQPALLAMLRGLASTVEGMVRDRAAPEPAREYPDAVTAFENLAKALPPGFEFPTMEADTSPLTHQEIFSAVLHHANEIVRLTACVPTACTSQPPSADHG